MTNFTLTNAEMINLIGQYQTTKDELVFNEIYAEVEPMARKIAIKFYNSKKADFDYIPVDDYIIIGQFAILKAVEQYDVTVGSPFNSFLKQLIIWTLQDEIVKKHCTKAEQFNTFASKNSLDKTVDSGDDHATYGDVVAHHFSTDIDAVFNDAFEMAEEQSSTDILGEIKEIISDFHDNASADDSNIIKLVFSTIVTVENATAKVVNTALANAMPQVKSATLRKRKSRAIERFTVFAKENGFSSLDLSQF